MDEKKDVVRRDGIRDEIERARSMRELNTLRSKVEALRLLSKQSRQSLVAQNRLAEYRLRIDRKRGAWLAANIIQSGNGSNQHIKKEQRSSRHTLAELRITKTESSVLQRLASISEESFEEHVAGAKNDSVELTTAGLLRLEAALRFANRESPPLPRGKFGVIYADPPWAYQSDHTAIRSVNLVYKTMSVDQICDMGEHVKKLAARDCTLFLWTPSAQLDRFPAVLDAWGFRFCTTWIWNKMAHNFGFYGSAEHEILVIGGRGRATPTCDPKTVQSVRSVQDIKKTKHSAKPLAYYGLIEKLYPNRRYLELFSRAREGRKGWTFWGDECQQLLGEVEGTTRAGQRPSAPTTGRRRPQDGRNPDRRPR